MWVVVEGWSAVTRGTLMHIQSVYTGLHHRNLEHKGCTFKSMHRPTMSNVIIKKRKKKEKKTERKKRCAII